MSFLGPLIGALGSLGGSLFGANAAEAGGRMSARATLKANRKNIKYQKLFAQKGIQWRAADARKAGIHPLAALGAQTVSFSPSVLGATQAGEGVAQAGNIMGQGLARAASAFGDTDDRNEQYIKQLQALQLENANLNNQKLSSELRLMNQPGTPPAAPSSNDRYTVPGQGHEVNLTPSTYVMPGGGRNVDPGFMNDTARVNTGGNTQAIVPGKDIKQAVEDTFVPEMQMAARHNIEATVNPRAAWVGKLQPYEDVSYNPITGQLTKFDGRRRTGVLSGKYGEYDFNSVRGAEEAYRRRVHFQRNAY